MLREWENLSLPVIIGRNIGKSASQCVELLITRLSDIQVSLPPEYHNDTILKNKLLNSVKKVEACRLAYQKPAETLQGIISDLHASVATVRTSDLSDPVVHYTDRHYHRRHQGKKGKFCLVCKKQGCWSTNHSTSERLAALKKHKQIRQFLTEIGEEDEDNDEHENSDGSVNELVDELEDIVTHMINIKKGPAAANQR